MNKLLLLLIGLVGHLFLPTDLMAQSGTNSFTLPVIPDTLQTVESRSSYLVAHYWDRFSFADSLQFMNQPEMVEQAVVDYVDLFRLVPATEAEKLAAFGIMRNLSNERDAQGNPTNWDTKAKKFKDYTNVRISDEYARSLAQDHMTNDLAHVRREFADFDTFSHYPLNVKKQIFSAFSTQKILSLAA